MASPLRRRHVVEGYLFLAPWLIGYVVFTAGPVLASLALSFTSYNLISAPRFVGFANYVEAFTKDQQFWPSLGRTFQYAVVSVPLGVVGSLLVALLLNVRVRGTSVFRTLFFMPSLVPIVAAAVLWIQLLQPDWGLLNGAIYAATGLRGPRWFEAPEWAMWGLIALALWTSVGGTRMVIFLAGLQGVPAELHDAASIDGAGAWGRFRHVTLPMITPVVFFNLVLGVITSLQVFTSAFVATGGGPAYATWFYALHIYKNAFSYFSMGYGSALAWLFLLIIVALTWLQFRTSRRWVYYAGGSD
ncbi:MAG TPA: sugar ABC transporter permease [Chloroflexota bacterium]|nr:sugar ABC transporter permease [Chloroflexota bacterium]